MNKRYRYKGIGWNNILDNNNNKNNYYNSNYYNNYDKNYNNQADYQADKSSRTSSAEAHKCFELSSNSSEVRPTQAQLTI